MAKKINKDAQIIQKQKVAIIALIILLCTSAVTSICYIQKTKISHEEQRRLEAFESLLYNYLSDEPFLENTEKTSTAIKNIGLSQDDDLYADFIIYYYNDNHEPVSYKNGKIFFQCNHEYRKPITGNEQLKACATAYSYGNLEEL